jgi:hypothetical protein
MNVSRTNANDPQVSTRNIGPAIRIAMLLKAKNAQKAEGEAALELIKSSSARAEHHDANKGTRVDRHA